MRALRRDAARGLDNHRDHARALDTSWSALLAFGVTSRIMADSSTSSEATQFLALPAPEEASGSITLDASTGMPVVMDHLGPIVVNADGTLARISNWDEMIDKEKEQTKRRIAKRNVERLRGLQEAGQLSDKIVSALQGSEPTQGA